ncbi:alpha/beta fold hydrolase [Sphingomicrobium sediminis]|uniref:Alpha/beta hydrolase n=1 Tax=Sphingomicrobium sediminis TaxID=2950949 RepID=A0A9X2EER7_9SPHN|nr:alpha/beta hydrolase [Sphingomicrobium sediminis]MCM8556648.1 alpha/beta hydrolase [Sphingomicrobium sediminis]
MSSIGLIAAAMTITSGPEAIARPQWWPDSVRDTTVETGVIKMQVYRAGDEGVAVVIMQDMHDYFDPAPKWEGDIQEQWIERGSRHRNFVATLAKQHRVFVPIRRGYGATEDPGVGYDVATYAEDVLAMLSKEGVERAVFIGRNPAQNDIYWIAEHHPERMIAMALFEPTPWLPFDFDNEDAFAFASGWWRGARDMGATDERIDELTLSRFSGAIPHFLSEEGAQIDVPLLYLSSPPSFEGAWMWANLFAFEDEDADCSEVTSNYPCSVFGDADRVDRLRTYFGSHPHNALAASTRERLEATFSDMTVVPYPFGDEFPSDIWAYYGEVVEPFLARFRQRQE